MRTSWALSVVFTLLGMSIAGQAAAQDKAERQSVVGVWSYVSVDTIAADAKRTPLFGPEPAGLAIFGSNGRYALLTTRKGLPKFTSGNRMEGTAEENKAVVQGSIGHFGTYELDEKGHTIVFHIEASTFPNWNGIDQKRPYTLSGDVLKWTTAASNGGTAEVVLRRAR